MNWLGGISRLLPVKNCRSHLYQIGARANHEQKHHENTAEVKNCGHRCMKLGGTETNPGEIIRKPIYDSDGDNGDNRYDNNVPFLRSGPIC
mmetsp:Transcript_6559/g.16164  ORF Transcript_6559/g.16164 Transcript_6559/m.16164 type:complete len:91 (-) Transcript_6559:100-372(-)